MATIKSNRSGKQAGGRKVKAPVVKKRARSVAKLCDELEKASAGLLHVSESDYPYQFFSLQHHGLHEDSDQLTALEFLACIGLSEELLNDLDIPAGQLVEERSFAGFFPSLDDLANSGADIKDPKVIAEAKRYRNLEKLLTRRLKTVKVFRVGRVEVRCYIAGFLSEGNIAGLVTTAIET